VRYITHISNLVLYTNGGEVGRDSTSHKAYAFGQQGELVIGSTTGTGSGYEIDASTMSDTDDQLQLLYATDLDGSTTTRLEMAGLGTLTTVTKTGGTVSPKNAGYRLFFEAPDKTGGDSVSGEPGVYYRVLTGTVTYAGTDYVAGKTFHTDGSTTSTTGTGDFRLSLPPDLTRTCENDDALAGIFANKMLLKGNESNDYWNYSESGAEPKDSTTSTDDDYYGWTS